MVLTSRLFESVKEVQDTQRYLGVALPVSATASTWKKQSRCAVRVGRASLLAWKIDMNFDGYKITHEEMV